MNNPIDKLIAVAKEWRQACVCANGDDNAKMDTAIEAAEEYRKGKEPNANDECSFCGFWLNGITVPMARNYCPSCGQRIASKP